MIASPWLASLNISGATLGLNVLVGGTGQNEYVLATFGSLAGPAFAAVEGLPADYRLEYDLSGKQIRLVKIGVGLTARSGAGGIYLAWAPEPGATSFTVRRATSSGGPYTVIAANITGTYYLDSTVGNGGTYYYTVQIESGRLFRSSLRYFLNCSWQSRSGTRL